MKRIIRLTESDLTRLVKQIINEESIPPPPANKSVSTTPPVNVKTINPTIEIDCVKKVILSSQLPKLDNSANLVIINHYCNK